MSPGRKALLAAFVVLLCLATGELAARIGLRLRHGSWGWAAAGDERGVVASGPTGRVQEPPGKILHPFVGYLRDPALPAPDRETPPVDASGFRRWPEEDRARGAFTIALMGGSLAERFSYRARQTLLAELERLHVLPGRPKRLLNYAMGGYKEPQQLAMVTYLLSNGEQPDLVINLDGFNEIVLSTADNLRHGINPYYPRMWAGELQDLPDRKRQALIGELAYLRERREELWRSCSGPLLRHSALCRLTLEARDAGVARRQLEVVGLLERLPAGAHDLERYGPPFPNQPAEQTYRELAAHWGRCSLLIAEICKARGIAYLHFLQPNQYVAGSKPMEEGERNLAYHPDLGYGPFAVAGYPYLIAEGRALPARGVAFRDLTAIFHDTAAPVYEDDCCHLNALGNELLGREIARTIASSVRR